MKRYIDTDALEAHEGHDLAVDGDDDGWFLMCTDCADVIPTVRAKASAPDTSAADRDIAAMVDAEFEARFETASDGGEL